MDSHAPESGLELVLDNRKLIVAFALLIAICGCFFVLGFVEGRRQNSRGATPNLAAANVGGQPEGQAAAGEPAGKPAEDRSVKGQLDWYKNVNGRGVSDSKSSEKPAGIPVKEAEPSKPPSEKPAAASLPAAVTAQSRLKSIQPTYSVQIGAFRDRNKADEAARSLKSKGYEFYIEASDSGVHFLRVGKFKARPEAVEMMHRLKKDGFPTIIKAN